MAKLMQHTQLPYPFYQKTKVEFSVGLQVSGPVIKDGRIDERLGLGGGLNFG